MEQNELIKLMFETGLIRFGEFTLKSGILSPIYIDLRRLYSEPLLWEEIVKRLYTLLVQQKDIDYLVGVPMTGLPLASILSYKLKIPLLVIRDREKSYGSKDLVLGEYKKGGKVVIIDDVITTGESKLEIIKKVESLGLQVKCIYVVVNRSRGEASQLKEAGYDLNQLWSIEEIVEILYNQGLIDYPTLEKVKGFLLSQDSKGEFLLSPKERLKYITNPITKKILNLVLEKQSNLIVSIDTLYSSSLIDLIHKVGKVSVGIKIHIDILRDFTPSLIGRLQELSEKYNFLLIEDRKFSDIGYIARYQFRDGVYNIYKWADIVTLHLISGEGILRALFEDIDREISSFVVAKMSSKESLYDESLTRTVIERASIYPNWVSGFIIHSKEISEIKKLRRLIGKEFILAMPGISIQKGEDELDQQYIGFEDPIKGGVDLLIIGRTITKGPNPETIAVKLKEMAWEIYSNTLNL